MPTKEATKKRAPAKGKAPIKAKARKVRTDIDLALGIVVDLSGSMHPIHLPTIEAVNEYMNGQRKQTGATYVTLVIFDTGFKHVYRMTPLGEVEPMGADVVMHWGSTALYDAIGHTIGSIEEDLAARGAAKVDKVLVSIFTDGAENASQEFNRGAIHDRIEAKQAVGWDFSYMGANHDPFGVAQPLGIRRSFTSRWQATPKGVEQAFLATEYSTQSYRGAVTDSANAGVPMASSMSSPKDFYGIKPEDEEGEGGEAK